MLQIPMTQAQFDALAARLKQEQDIALTGAEGTISKMGVTAKYAYRDGVLGVEILEKPFFVSTEYCEEQLKKALGAV